MRDRKRKAGVLRGPRELITGASYAEEVADAVVETEKFTLHKDNPTQIPSGRRK
ncbi:MAG TPA: hypothetical protein VJT67_14480 [Longimicrobiaceae bacterium]|nr:hypothetical protein [Longimicrobiaceae bacterium]